MAIKELQAYELLREEGLSDIQSVGYLLRHRKSGARIMVIANDDDNKVFHITFRTPPVDSTGVAHILEHCSLCGSEKFPSKDPFVELVKGSLNTFLNAMTYPDKVHLKFRDQAHLPVKNRLLSSRCIPHHCR